MINKLKDNQGVLMVLLIVSIVVVSFVITTAFYDLVRLDNQRKIGKTEEKMQAIAQRVVGNTFQVMNEAGADLTYVNEHDAFPANMAAFVTANYLENYGLTSTLYEPEDDAFGNDIVMSSAAGTFTISSTSPSVADIDIDEAMYNAVSCQIIIEDVDASHELSADYFTAASTGLYNIGTSTRLDAFTQVGGADSGIYSFTSSVGRYDIVLEERSDLVPAGTWVQTILGAGNTTIKVGVIITPENSGSLQNVRLRLPIDL